MTSCSRAWMVEAARVGQLSPAEAQSLREHVEAGCAICGAEQRYLDWLGRQLRASNGGHDELALRRLRRSTLQAASALVYRPPFARRRALLVTSVVACAVALLTWNALGRAPEIVVTSLAAGSGKAVHRARESGREVVRLADGEYQLSVRRWLLDRKVTVKLPDGEIEDLGTVFSVRVTGQKTERVAVTRGAVALRLHGLAEIRLAEGEAWELAGKAPAPTLPPLAIEAAPNEGAPAPAQPAADSGAPQSLKAVEHTSRRHHLAKAPPAAPPVVAPSASRSLEDATYLRVLDLLRAKHVEEARGLARAYLDRFPNGFRRIEMQQLVDPPRK